MIASQTDPYVQTLDNVRDIFQQGKVVKAIAVIVQFLDIHPDYPEGLHLFGTLLVKTGEQLKSNACDDQDSDGGIPPDSDIKTRWIDIVSDAEKSDAVKLTDLFQKIMADASSLEVENLLSAEVGLALSSLLTRISIVSLRRAVKLGAGSTAIKDLASIMVAEGSVDEAVKIINDGVHNNPGDVQLLAFQAKILDLLGMREDIDESRLSACVLLINKRESTLAATSMETKVITKLSKDIAKAGNGDEAERIIKTNIFRHPVTTDQLVEQAWTFYYSGLNELACKTAYTAGVTAPRRKDVLALLEKTVFAKTGETEELDESLRRAVSSPDDPTNFYSLGNALRDKGLHMEAVAAFREGLKYKPDHVEAWLRIISIVHHKHHLEAAVIMSENLIGMAPDNPLVHLQHGDLMSQSGRPEDAVLSYRKTALLDHSIKDIDITIGKQLLGTGYLKEALASFHSAVSHDPGNYRNLEALAEAMTLSGRYGDATVWLRRALLLNKGSVDIRQKLAESLFRCEHWKEGHEYLPAPSCEPRMAKPDWPGSNPVPETLLAYHRPEDTLERTLIGMGVAARMASSGYTVICECPPSVAKMGIPPANGISIVEYLSNNVDEIISNNNVTDHTPLADLVLIPGQPGLPLPEWLGVESEDSIAPTAIGNVILAHSEDKLRSFPRLGKLFNEIESAASIPTKKIRTDAKLSAIATTIKRADAVITDDPVVALISGALGVPSIFIVANNSPWWWGDHRQLSPLAKRQMMIRVDMDTETDKIVGEVRRMLNLNIPPHAREPRLRPSMNNQPLIEMFDRAGSFLGHHNDEIVRVEALNGNHVYRAFCPKGDKLVRIGRFPPPARGFFSDEIHSMTAASKVGLAPRVTFSDVSDGAMVCEFIDGETMSRESMKLFVNALSVARMFVSFNKLEPFRRKFDIFDKIEQNTKRLQRNKVSIFIENKACNDLVERIRIILAGNGVPARSSHNNPLLHNFILRHGKMILVGWGNAAMSDPHWELSAISVQANMDDKLRETFLNEYFEVDDHPALCRIPLFEVVCCYHWWTEALCASLNKPEETKPDGEVDNWRRLFRERASHKRLAPALEAAENYRWNP